MRNQIYLKAILLVLTGLCCAFPATAAPLLREQVVALKGTELQLAQTGPARFADVIFPDAALAESWLSPRLLQRELAFEGQGEDRYGRMLVRSDIEISMLRDGIALAYSSKAIPPVMLQAEAAARIAKRGVWADKNLVLTPQTVTPGAQMFRVVEGTITHLYKGRSAIYLNFGEDWKSDFSVGIARRYARSFKQLDALQEGSRVRVRGIVTEENGPMIQLTRPEQLELL